MLMLVTWWRHQNKDISFCFNPNFLITLISSFNLINCLWLKLRSNKPAITLVFDTTWRNQNGGIFWGVLVSLFFMLMNLNSTLSVGRRGMANKTIITLKINSWKRHQKLERFLNALISLFIWKIVGHLSLKMRSDKPHFVRASPKQIFC